MLGPAPKSGVQKWGGRAHPERGGTITDPASKDGKDSHNTKLYSSDTYTHQDTSDDNVSDAYGDDK